MYTCACEDAIASCIFAFAASREHATRRRRHSPSSVRRSIFDQPTTEKDGVTAHKFDDRSRQKTRMRQTTVQSAITSPTFREHLQIRAFKRLSIFNVYGALTFSRHVVGDEMPVSMFVDGI